jgi:hypothetical protein
MRPDERRLRKPSGMKAILNSIPRCFPAEELAAQLEPWRNRAATLGKLRAAAEGLVGYYRERGWYARVQIPPQDSSDGTLRIRSIEGRFGQLRTEPAPGLRADAAAIGRVVGHRLQPGQPYSQDALERGLLLANDLPGQGALQPGGYNLTVSGLTAANYQIAYGEGLLTILGGAQLTSDAGQIDRITRQILPRQATDDMLRSANSQVPLTVVENYLRVD